MLVMIGPADYAPMGHGPPVATLGGLETRNKTTAESGPPPPSPGVHLYSLPIRPRLRYFFHFHSSIFPCVLMHGVGWLLRPAFVFIKTVQTRGSFFKERKSV